MYATIRTLPHYFPEIFVNRIIISVIAFAMFCAVSIFLYKRHKFNKAQCFAAILLSLYIVVLLYFTVTGRYSHEEYEYKINFFTSYRWFFQYNGEQVLRQLLINFVMYNGEQVLRQLLINFVMLMPVGFLLPVVINAKHKYLITMALSLLLTVFIETMQLITKCGSFEIDDIINNFVGAVLGMLLYVLCSKLIKPKTNKVNK